MALIVTEQNCISIDGSMIPKGTATISPIGGGVRVSIKTGVYDIMLDGSTIDGNAIDSVDDMVNFFKENSFNDGGGNGSGVAGSINGLVSAGEGISVSGEGTAESPYILVATTPDSLVFQAFWNVATNDPTLSNSVPSTNGFFYIVTDADPEDGTVRDLGNGNQTFRNGDWVVWADIIGRWGKVVASNNVLSVNGKVGEVVLSASDVGAVPEEYVETIMSSIYPIGSVFISGTNSMPALVAAVGTWARLEGRVIIGASSTYASGSTGGESEHTLTVDEMPSHNHYVNNTFFSGGGGTFSVSSFGGSDYNKRPSLDNTGGDQAHNNMQPYKAKYMWERVS